MTDGSLSLTPSRTAESSLPLSFSAHFISIKRSFERVSSEWARLDHSSFSPPFWVYSSKGPSPPGPQPTPLFFLKILASSPPTSGSRSPAFLRWQDLHLPSVSLMEPIPVLFSLRILNLRLLRYVQFSSEGLFTKNFIKLIPLHLNSTSS